MRRFGKRGIRRREMIAMVTTSVFVLGALTVTGLYIKNRNEADNQDGYYIDFDALEAEIEKNMIIREQVPRLCNRATLKKKKVMRMQIQKWRQMT